MMNNPKEYTTIREIKQDLKVLRLKKEISYELLHANKEDFQDTLQPLTLVNKVLGPFKKIIVVYLLKKVFK